MAKLTMQMTKDELCPFIEAQGKELQRMILNARMKFGKRYNYRNQYQLMIDKFGNPEKNPEKYYDEYRLILQKKSKLPASVRYTVDEIQSGGICVTPCPHGKSAMVFSASCQACKHYAGRSPRQWPINCNYQQK